MAHPFPGQHQAHQGQMPHQNIGQQRQNPMAQHGGPVMSQQKGMQGQQPLQNSFSNYDPQLALFTFVKPNGATSWEDAEPQQQHVTVRDLLNDLKKFQRNKGSVQRELKSIPSMNCRRVISELVENQNHELEVKNRTLKWNIASIDIDWKETRRQRQLKSVSVILQTGPSGYAHPAPIKGGAPMAPKSPGFGQHPPQAGHGNNQHPGQPPMGQPPMGPPQQSMPQGLPPPPPPGHSGHGPNPLPPPPPPGGMSDFPPPPPRPGAPGMPGAPPPHLPPPPPGLGPGIPRPPGHGQQQHRPMPGAFPEAAHRPPMGQPPIEVLDPFSYRKQKKHHGHHEESVSDSQSDSDDWDTESGDSGPDHMRVRHVERGEFAHIGRPKRGRSRHSPRSKKPHHNKSHGKSRSRSRSHVRTEHRRRRNSDHMEPPPMGKYSPTSSQDSSPRPSKQQLPPIHIHMNAPAAEKSTRANDRIRRDSFGASSPDYRHKKLGGEPMSREGSWDRNSGTASFNDNSSILTADDSVFSEPDRRRPTHRSDVIEQPRFKSRNLPPRDTFGYPHASNVYDDAAPRTRRTAYPTPNDYPHQRDYFEDRPALHRRSSVQTPQSNPFDASRHPPRFGRANTFGPDTHDAMFSPREQRYLSDRPGQDRLHLDELHDAIEHLREKQRRPLQGRRASDYDRLYEGDYGYGRRY